MEAIIETTSRRALLIGLTTRDGSAAETEISMKELVRLAETADIAHIASLTQSRSTPDNATFIGSGKLTEAKEIALANDINLVIFDNELSPAQIKNINKEFGDDIEVIDRTMLILEIFAAHAVTGEGKLQVEIAALRYMLPRLVGKGNQLSRLGGGGGGAGAGARRGSGETKLETDRRHIKSRITALERQLEQLETSRAVMRKRREKSEAVKVAIAGYTNSGKSTLLNKLTGADVTAQDKLFATLDPTTRRLHLPNGRTALFTDTVGFIRNLPHHLVKAFKSTLEEIKYCDVILLVADISDPEYVSQIDVAVKLIQELGAQDKPMIYVYNKCDRMDGVELPAAECNRFYVSAKRGDNLERMLERIAEN